MDEKTLLFIYSHIIKATFLSLLPPFQRSQQKQGFFQSLLCRTEILKNICFKRNFFIKYDKLMKQTAMMDIIFGDCLMFCQVCLSQQVKQSVVISYKDYQTTYDLGS